MRTLSLSEISKIETHAWCLLISEAISMSAAILGCSLDEARATYENPPIRELLSDPVYAAAFISNWEEVCAEAATQLGCLDEDDVVMRVIATFGSRGLETQIIIYDESDFDDE